MRPIEVHEAISRTWDNLPVGMGADFNTIILYIERLEAHVHPKP